MAILLDLRGFCGADGELSLFIKYYTYCLKKISLKKIKLNLTIELERPLLGLNQRHTD